MAGGDACGPALKILDDILAAKRADLPRLRALARQAAPRPRAPRRAFDALRRDAGQPLRLIAEIKRRSPSAGPLSMVLSAGDRARAYAEAGATMVSVLADTPFFAGGWEDVREAAEALCDAAVGVLAKEFVVDPVQVDLAEATGADLVLVIARILPDDGLLRALVDRSRAAGIEALVEVASEPELERALAAGARIVGVNARDLDTLVVDVGRAHALSRGVPDGVVSLHLSGLRSDNDVRTVARGRSDGALVGEILMREDDPRPLLRSYTLAANG